MSIRGMAAGYVRQLRPRTVTQHPSPSPRLAQVAAVAPAPPPVAGVALVAPAAPVAGAPAGAPAPSDSSAQRVLVASQSAIGAIAQDITNWIPTEVVAAYVAMVAVFAPTALPKNCAAPLSLHANAPAFYLWLAIIIGTIVSPLAVYFAARLQATQNNLAFPPRGGPIFSMAASAIAFLVWVNYLPGSMLQLCVNEPAGAPALILIGTQLLIYVAALGLDAFGVIDVPLNLPDVVAGARSGALFGPTGSGGGGDGDDDIGDVPFPRPVAGYKTAVIASPDVVPLFLGNAWNDAQATQRNECYAFLQTFLSSANYQLLQAPYGVGPATLRAPIVAQFTPAASPCTSTEIEGAIFAQISTGTTNTPNSTVFVCFAPPGVTVKNVLDNQSTCIQTCGFHQQDPHRIVTYAVIPYIYSGCDNCVMSKYGRTAVDSMMSAITHELAETLTNPRAPDPYSPGFHTPDNGGYEIGDMCVDQSTQLGNYRIQKLYVNNVGCE